jgi:probable F420-dependent oxidoreductase|tara:strand:- start:742 stop:1656 length:915 start_codon:yes stop_codon:yes gene_type:complete
MKLTVEFPSVSYRWGPEGIIKLAQAVEQIGFDQLDMFDHVVMGYGTATRAAPMYPPQMPIMEAIVMLSFIAAATNRIGLGTEVLVLPQRNPTLTAKQVSTLDTLSGGRVRLGVGVGWQESEYEALGEDFGNRGRRMDEAINLLRRYWSEKSVSANSQFYQFEAIAMEPKPPQGRKLPIWIGGSADATMKRVGELGDGWLATSQMRDAEVVASKSKILEYVEAAGRDVSAIGFQMMLDTPPRDEAGKGFYADKEKVFAAAERIKGFGFEWMAINMTAIFQAGARSVEELVEQVADVHDALHERFD